MGSPIQFLWILVLFLKATEYEYGTGAVEPKICKDIWSDDSCLSCRYGYRYNLYDEIDRGKAASDKEAFNVQQWNEYKKIGEKEANERCSSKHCIPIKKYGIQLFTCFGNSGCFNLLNGWSCLFCEFDFYEIFAGKEDTKIFNAQQWARYKALGVEQANQRCKSKQCKPVEKDGIQLFLCEPERKPVCKNLSNGTSCLTCDNSWIDYPFGNGTTEVWHGDGGKESFNEQQWTKYKELGEKKANERCSSNSKQCMPTKKEGVQLFFCSNDSRAMVYPFLYPSFWWGMHASDCYAYPLIQPTMMKQPPASLPPAPVSIILSNTNTTHKPLIQLHSYSVNFHKS